MNNLPIIKKKGFWEKINRKIKSLLGIGKEGAMLKEVQPIKQDINKNNFREEIKFEEDLEKKKLLDVQRKLEDGGITTELAEKLTKDLTSEEKGKLLELYKTQINDLEESLKNYKNKILEIRKRV